MCSGHAAYFNLNWCKNPVHVPEKNFFLNSWTSCVAVLLASKGLLGHGWAVSGWSADLDWAIARGHDRNRAITLKNNATLNMLYNPYFVFLPTGLSILFYLRPCQFWSSTTTERILAHARSVTRAGRRITLNRRVRRERGKDFI